MPIFAANTLYGLTSIEQYTVLSARCYNAFQLLGCTVFWTTNNMSCKFWVNKTHNSVLYACCFVRPCKSIFMVTRQP